jgi:hypothetical protein
MHFARSAMALTSSAISASSAISVLMRQSQPHEKFAMGGKAWIRRDGLVPVAHKKGLTQRSQRSQRTQRSQRGQVIGASRDRVAALSSRLMQRFPVAPMRHLANRAPGIASRATRCAQAGTHKHFKRLKTFRTDTMRQRPDPNIRCASAMVIISIIGSTGDGRNPCFS